MRLVRGDRERRGTPADLLVVGLGNPGEQYARTRHNVGAEVVGELAARGGASLKRSKERALTAEVTRVERRLALAFPQTFYNEAGSAALLLTRRYGIDDPHRVVIVHDELDLPPGTIRVKLGGGLAGNNGLKSVKAHLKTDDFVRVRLGVGKPPGSQQGADHVLRQPGKAERVELDVAVQEAADAIELLAARGIEAAMNRYNTRAS